MPLAWRFIRTAVEIAFASAWPKVNGSSPKARSLSMMVVKQSLRNESRTWLIEKSTTHVWCWSKASNACGVLQNSGEYQPKVEVVLSSRCQVFDRWKSDHYSKSKRKKKEPKKKEKVLLRKETLLSRYIVRSIIRYTPHSYFSRSKLLLQLLS